MRRFCVWPSGHFSVTPGRCSAGRTRLPADAAPKARRVRPAHARRKLFEAHELNASPIAGHAVALIGKLYEIEAEIKALAAEDRRRIRQQRAKPVAEQLHDWLVGQRQKLAKADATAKAIDYSLKRWSALTRYLDDGNRSEEHTSELQSPLN